MSIPYKKLERLRKLNKEIDDVRQTLESFKRFDKLNYPTRIERGIEKEHRRLTLKLRKLLSKREALESRII